MTKMFLQKGRTKYGLVLTAKAQAVVNSVKDRSTLEKWGKGQSGATPNIKVIPATTKDLKPSQAELNPEVLHTSEKTFEPLVETPVTPPVDPVVETPKASKKTKPPRH